MVRPPPNRQIGVCFDVVNHRESSSSAAQIKHPHPAPADAQFPLDRRARPPARHCDCMAPSPVRSVFVSSPESIGPATCWTVKSRLPSNSPYRARRIREAVRILAAKGLVEMLVPRSALASIRSRCGICSTRTLSSDLLFPSRIRSCSTVSLSCAMWWNRRLPVWRHSVAPPRT